MSDLRKDPIVGRWVIIATDRAKRPQDFARLEPVLKAGSPLLLKVRVQIEEAGTRLSLQEARKLEGLAERAAVSEFRVRLTTESLAADTLDRLEELLANAPGGSPVIFELRSADGSLALLQSQSRVRATPELIEAVRQLCGQQAVAAGSA